MKATKQMKKVVCAVLAGGLILGCLAGCGDKEDAGGSKDAATEQLAEATPAPQATEAPSTPQEAEVSPTPQATEEPSAPQEEVVFSGPEDKNCTSYVIPEGVTKIGDQAFYGCQSLTSIHISPSFRSAPLL